jgi:hypothetical protein
MYRIGALIAGIIIFIGVWIYAIVSWGFLIGIAIGWLPALISAVIGGFIWPLIILILIILAIFIFG